jgi:hypothetical protein
MDKELFTIWMAGCYESAGCTYNVMTKNNKIRLIIEQRNDATPLYKAQQYWGGDIVTGNYINRWRLEHEESLKFIDDIKKYLQNPYKINQIEKVVENSKIRLNIKFKCNYCDRLYASPSSVKRHEKNVHGAEL